MISDAMKSGKILLVLLLSPACSQNPVADSDLNPIVVLAALSPDFERQAIYLDEGANLINIDELKIDELAKPVQNARVVVKSESQEVIFKEVAPGKYQDTETALVVESGKTYQLEVTDPRGRILRAQTTVPGAFHILSPENGATFAHNSEVEFRWQPSSGAVIYLLGRLLTECEPDPFGRDFAYHRLTDTTMVSTIAWMDPRCDSLQQVQTFKVLAYDTALSSYLFFINSDGARARRSNIENGVGVFGSLVSDSLTIVVVPKN